MAVRSRGRLIRLVVGHARLFGSMAVTVVAFVILCWVVPWLRSSTRMLVAWDVGIAVYLVLAFVVIGRFDVALARRRAEIQDEGGSALLVLTTASAVASLAAIFVEVGTLPKDGARAPYIALAVVTIALSWTFIQVIFALHYAHEFYDVRDEGGGFQFPEDDHPDYWDFVYFSFVVGMTFQVSDVQVTSKSLRRLVVAHGVVSFVFNVAILALVVNLGASLI
jgi:uncharacterized membrane protein